ncbi:hypothetical protein L2E82_40506 [Cichorium intybus]|uniref:Uncharacterized protein n=1 Tax=Cichorium intybus TaxID=13427 RepID=A0ACB9AKM7_CICIN|nr:hypothetical protein L2E82_40506 [Cichorium intybus]
MEIKNLLQKQERQRGTWNGKKADNDFYKKIVDAYEAKNLELVAENDDLRALLRSMQVDMRDFLNAPNGSSKHPSPVRDADPSQSQLGGRTVNDDNTLLILLIKNSTRSLVEFESCPTLDMTRFQYLVCAKDVIALLK